MREMWRRLKCAWWALREESCDCPQQDAPEGPWFVEHKDGCLQPAVFREAPFRVAFTGTQKECNAVRDALNRLKGDAE